MQDVVRGQLRVRLWPEKRKARRSQEQLDREYAFKEAGITAKQWPADMQADYRQAVEGTALLPTDLIFMTIYGNTMAVKLENGRTYYTMASRTKVSESLDIISQLAGSILARGEDYWGEIPPGTEGQVLLMGPDLIPYWADVDPTLASAAANVAADQNTGSVVYANLATAGPSVSILTGATAIVSISTWIYKPAAGAGCNGYMAVAVSGATTIAAADVNGITWSAFVGGGFVDTISRTMLITGLTPGVNTFTAKYKANCQNFNFLNRSIAAWAL